MKLESGRAFDQAAFADEGVDFAGDDGRIAVKQNSPVLRHGTSPRSDIVRVRTIGCRCIDDKATGGDMSDRGFMFRRGQRLEPAQAARSAGPRANETLPPR